MRREVRLLAAAPALLGWATPAGAVTTYVSRPAFLEAAGLLHLEDFEAAPLVGDVGGDGVEMLAFDGFRVQADRPSLKLLDVASAGNHSTSTFGPRYLTADTGSLSQSARLTLTFEPPVDRLGFFLVDLDSFDMGITINGAAYAMPATGNGMEGYFGIISGAPFSEVELAALGSDNHYSLDDLSFPQPPAPVAAGGVPDGSLLRPGPLLTIAPDPAGGLLLSWGASCTTTDFDFEIYEGVLGDYASHAPLTCSTGGANADVVQPPAGSAYYLVVPRNETREGSHGRTSAGEERPPPVSTCLLRLPPRCQEE